MKRIQNSYSLPPLICIFSATHRFYSAQGHCYWWNIIILLSHYKATLLILFYNFIIKYIILIIIRCIISYKTIIFGSNSKKSSFFIYAYIYIYIYRHIITLDWRLLLDAPLPSVFPNSLHNSWRNDAVVFIQLCYSAGICM